MGKVDSTNSEQLDFSKLGETSFDCTDTLAQGGSFKYALRGQGKPYKTLIVETQVDGNGNSSGSVYVYLGSAVSGRPWRIIALGSARSGPVPAVDFLTFVPTVGAQGIVNITLSTEIWSVNFKKPATATYFPLEDLTDASIASPVAGQLLKWNGSAWVNSYETLEELADVGVSFPVNGQVLTYENGEWINASPSGGASAFDTAALALVGLTHYWKCNDIVGTTSIADSVGTLALPVTGSASLGGRPVCRDGEPTLQTFQGVNDGATINLANAFPSSGAVTFFLVANVRLSFFSSGGVAQIYTVFSAASGYTQANFDMRTGGSSGGQTPGFVASVGTSSGHGNTYNSGVGITPTSPCLIVFEDNGSNSTNVYIDGYFVGTVSFAMPRTGTMFIGNNNNANGSNSGGSVGSFGKIGVVAGTLSQAQIVSLLGAM